MTKQGKELWFFIILIIVLQVLISFQGFDFCDEGFSLTFYQQFFNAPESVEYVFVYWLSGLVGGLWYEINPNGGILWFRILAILVNTSSFILGYKILKNFINTRLALVGLTMVLFANDFGFLVFYHNHLTTLLVLLSIYLLYRGILKKHKRIIFAAGFVVSVNYVTRIPNLTMTILVLAIPFAFILKMLSKSLSLKMVLQFVIGLLCGIGSIVLLLFAFGQLDIMESAIQSLFSLGRTSDSAHGILFLIKITLGNYKKVVVIIALLLLLFGLISYLKSLKISKLLSLLIDGFSILCLCILIYFGKIHFVYAFGIIGVLSVIINKNEEAIFRIIALLGLLMLVCLPLGSGGGMVSSGTMCIWLALPVGLHVMFNYGLTSASFVVLEKPISINLYSRALVKLGRFIVVIFLAIKAYNISQRAYFDHGARWQKKAIVNHRLATNIYTTEQRSSITNDVLEQLKLYVKPDDYLFAYDKIPMLHFLTETKPYLYNPWPWIFNGELFEQKLNKAETTIEKLPIIVQQKFETIYQLSEPFNDYLDEEREDSERFNASRTKAFNTFLEKHNYQIVWNNAYFNIYKSEKSE
ncbi:hypothetical protein RM697_11340 [Ichthyenterobacterium sp. W332]|uniref:Glycosyltransferase RgtA/B/C/D-like domain-containing protein n=1 Tax=Microcosmobacter mediterraneus TaxID=3075607 RepID=A0ABU2YM63_9FLAO|nr:hypothetical protein [Ichthyenterobacterium sp. W332]MDT0559248.1 hypothetical protein [Ichthyenterobacterium sp. W332]